MTITERALKSKNNFPTDKPHQDLADGGGLLARFYKSGKISFCYRFRWQGKQAILTIGTYPQVSLKEARERCQRQKSNRVMVCVVKQQNERRSMRQCKA
ncbi:Arm DNA-binding domain-containing protein, partial [Vibrio parahaemolyticus]